MSEAPLDCAMKVTKFSRSLPLIFLTLATGFSARAVDYFPSAPPAATVPIYGGFNPLADPRCRIVPMPQANLFGDTARFRPTAVCQSRGLYADSVLFP